MSDKMIRFKDMARLSDEPLCKLKVENLMKLPFIDDEPPFTAPPAKLADKYDLSFDGYTPIGIEKVKTEEDKRRLVEGFFSKSRIMRLPQNSILKNGSLTSNLHKVNP